MDNNNKCKKISDLMCFWFKCLLLGLTLIGTFTLYASITNFNDRLTDLEDIAQLHEKRLYYAEYKTANCAPND